MPRSICSAPIEGHGKQLLRLPGCFGKGSLLWRILREEALVFVLTLLAQISQIVVSLPVDLRRTGDRLRPVRHAGRALSLAKFSHCVKIEQSRPTSALVPL